jgi:hypothetical protein
LRHFPPVSADSHAHHRGNDCVHRGFDTGANKGSVHGENQKASARCRKRINHPIQIFSLQVSSCQNLTIFH